MSEITIAGMTALFGVFVFVIGQILQRFLLEPIQEQRKVIGEIAFAFIYYQGGHHYYDKDTAKEVQFKLRSLAGELRRGLEVIPFYRLLSFLRIIPKKRDVIVASRALVGWSNSVANGNFDEHIERIANAMKIDWKGEKVPNLN